MRSNNLTIDKETNRIISYMGSKYIDNTGTIQIPVADERFITKNFRYIVKTAFNSLSDAISAEERLLKLAKQYEDTFLKGVPIGGLSNEDAEIIKQNAKTQLLSDLSNILEGNENSIAVLQSKIADLEQQLVEKTEIINDWAKQQQRWNASEELYTENIIRAGMEIDTLERANAGLLQAQEETLDQIASSISRQESYVSSSISKIELKTAEQIEGIKDQLEKADNIGNIQDLTKALEIEYKNPNSLTEQYFRSLNRINAFNATAGTAGTAGIGG